MLHSILEGAYRPRVLQPEDRLVVLRRVKAAGPCRPCPCSEGACPRRAEHAEQLEGTVGTVGTWAPAAPGERRPPTGREMCTGASPRVHAGRAGQAPVRATQVGHLLTAAADTTGPGRTRCTGCGESLRTARPSRPSATVGTVTRARSHAVKQKKVATFWIDVRNDVTKRGSFFSKGQKMFSMKYT